MMFLSTHHAVRCRLAWVLTLLVLLVAQPAVAQPPNTKVDAKSEQIFQNGVKSFEAKMYDKALLVFADILARPENRLTTSAYYMIGLSAFYLKKYEDAIGYFQRIVNDYSTSTYYEDAQYHKGLCLLQTPSKREAGLYLLLNTIEQAKASQLSLDATNALNYYYYQVFDSKFLESYYPIVRTSFKAHTFDALCYAYYKEGKTDALKKALEDYQKQNGKLTPKTQKLVSSGTVGAMRIDTLRIALVMPFSMENGSFPTVAVEFLQGAQLALDNLKLADAPQVEFRVFNNEQDEAATLKLLQGPVKQFRPQVIIGPVYRKNTKVISTFAAANGIIHLVPFASSRDQIEGNETSFLMNPSLEAQGAKLAAYGADKLDLPTFYVLKDTTNSSLQLAKGFTDYLTKQNIPFVERSLGTTPYAAIKDVVASFNSSPKAGIYFPCSNEDIVITFLEAVKGDTTGKKQVFGSTDWQHFQDIKLELLFRNRAIFPNSYFQQNDTTEFAKMAKLYGTRFNGPPSAYVCQGYDVIRLLVTNIKRSVVYDPFTDVLHKAKSFVGLNQNYYFAKGQENLSIMLYRFGPEGIEQLKPW